jgi:hypothetical protein
MVEHHYINPYVRLEVLHVNLGTQLHISDALLECVCVPELVSTLWKREKALISLESNSNFSAVKPVSVPTELSWAPLTDVLKRKLKSFLRISLLITS